MATRTGNDLAAWREASQGVFEFDEECFDLKVTADTIAGAFSSARGADDE